jgi:ABC-type polysaccharide/polyol phosphate export permease
MVAALKNAFRFPAVAVRHGDILKALVSRDVKSRYTGSLLGRLWPVLQPLLLLAIFSLVFSQMLKVKFETEGARLLVEPGWMTVFFLLTGILPWQCTAESVSRCTQVVVDNSNLIKKVAFPSELLPTYATMVGFVQMLIGFALLLPVYVVVMLISAHGDTPLRLALIGQMALWLPVTVALHFVFATGLGMLLGAVNVFVRDVGQALPLALQTWMFFSPIWYRLDTIEKSGVSWLVTAMKVNPLYHLLAMYRGCFAYEEGATFPYESARVFTAIAFGVFLVGHACFHRWKGWFADEV